MKDNLEGKKMTKENIGSLINRVQKAQIYTTSKNAKKIKELEGDDVEQQVAKRVFLEILSEVLIDLDASQEDRKGTEIIQKTRRAIIDMCQSIKSNEKIIVEEITQQLDNVKALTSNAEKYFKSSDKYAILDFVQKRYGNNNILKEKTEDEQLRIMVQEDRYWPIENQKVFETLNTRDKDYKIDNGNGYVECGLIHACMNNTEQNCRSEFANIKKDINSPTESKMNGEGYVTLNEQLVEYRSSLATVFNKQNYPDITDTDIENSRKLIDNYVNMYERSIKLQRVIDMVQDTNSPLYLDFKKRDKLLQQMKKDMQVLTEEMKKSYEKIDILKDEISTRESNKDCSEKAGQRKNGRRTIKDKEMRNLAETRTLDGINGASNRAKVFFKNLMKGRNEKDTEGIENSD